MFFGQAFKLSYQNKVNKVDKRWKNLEVPFITDDLQT